MKKVFIKLISTAFVVALFAVSAQANDFNYVSKNATGTESSAPGIYSLTVTWRVNAGTLVQSWEGGNTVYYQNLNVYVKPGKVLEPINCSFVVSKGSTSYHGEVRYAGDNTYNAEVPLMDGYDGYTGVLTLKEYNGTGSEIIYFNFR